MPGEGSHIKCQEKDIDLRANASFEYVCTAPSVDRCAVVRPAVDLGLRIDPEQRARRVQGPGVGEGACRPLRLLAG